MIYAYLVNVGSLTQYNVTEHYWKDLGSATNRGATRSCAQRYCVIKNVTMFLVRVKSCLAMSVHNRGRALASTMESEVELEISIEDAPRHSLVWEHFGYPVDIINGDRMTDKTATICKHCKKIVPYITANTSTLQKIQPPRLKSTQLKRQTTLTNAWEMVNVDLQAHPLFESHTGAHIAEVLRVAVTNGLGA